MSDYSPNRWVVLSVTNGEKTHYRVFGTWGGGYLSGDSWRMNSGITEAAEVAGVFHFTGSSGSVYNCRKESYGSTAYGWSIISSMIKDHAERDIFVKVLDENTNFLELNYGD